MLKETFIKKAKDIHGDKYDYSNVNYEDYNKRVCIICPKHGEFYQTPHNHLSGHGCSKCANERLSVLQRRSIEDFVRRAREIHGDKYDYSKVEYVNAHTKVCLTCPKHGVFYIRPYNFLNKKGCYMCGREQCSKKLSLSTLDFVSRAREVHGDKYDYSKVEYTNNHTKVCIIHSEYGEFWQTPSTHLKGGGHPKERGQKLWNSRGRITTENFIDRAKKIHKDKYDYSKTVYVTTNSDVCIICPKHGEFWQTPSNHLHKTSPKGCPKCAMSHLETEIMNFLEEQGIEYIYNCGKKIFPWLKMQKLDFYLPKYKVAIECQGEQHFKPVSFGSKNKCKHECFKNIIERDKRKKCLCATNDIRILYYSNLKLEYPYKVYENKEEMINDVVNG